MLELNFEEIEVDWERMSPATKKFVLNKVLTDNADEIREFMGKGGSALTLLDHLEKQGIKPTPGTLRKKIREMNLNPLFTSRKKD